MTPPNPLLQALMSFVVSPLVQALKWLWQLLLPLWRKLLEMLTINPTPAAESKGATKSSENKKAEPTEKVTRY